MKIKIVIFSIVFLIGISSSRGQVIKEEKEEKLGSAVRLLNNLASSYKLRARVNLIYGYDTNPRLSSIRKGDSFEEFIYSLSLRKKLGKSTFFGYYDFDLVNYSEFTDLSNYLNHLRLGADRRFGKVHLGIGIDYTYLWYPHYREGDFFFLKKFLYIRQRISRRLRYEISYENGAKNYQHNKSLGDTIGVYQDKKRRDERNTFALKFGYRVMPRLYLRWKNYFSLNDSNARYVDYYDYKSYRTSLGCNYKLSSRWFMLWDFTYQRKNYSSRTVTLRSYSQRDNLYITTIELIYKLNPHSRLYTYYTYRQNSSNDAYEEYSDSIMGIGIRYQF